MLKKVNEMKHLEMEQVYFRTEGGGKNMLKGRKHQTADSTVASFPRDDV